MKILLITVWNFHLQSYQVALPKVGLSTSWEQSQCSDPNNYYITDTNKQISTMQGIVPLTANSISIIISV